MREEGGGSSPLDPALRGVSQKLLEKVYYSVSSKIYVPCTPVYSELSLWHIYSLTIGSLSIPLSLSDTEEGGVACEARHNKRPGEGEEAGDAHENAPTHQNHPIVSLPTVFTHTHPTH